MPDAPITYPLTEEGVGQALVALGTTASAVATNLTAMGFKGAQYMGDACPVARYLVATVGGVASNPYAGRQSCSLYSLEPYLRVVRRTPPPVAAFMDEFDMGQYPDLIEETPDA